MDFEDIKKLFERYMPMYFNARGISFSTSFPNEKSIKLVAEYEGHTYIIIAKEV